MIMAATRPAFTLIGDLVASRRAGDRRLLQSRLDAVLDEVNKILKPVVPLEPTIGDEFQASFDRVATAVGASLLIRLALLNSARVDSRYGLGIGQVEVLGRKHRMSQDGPGWWSAREAIISAKQLSEAQHTGFVRTYLCAHSSRWTGEVAALNAFLLCRDAIVDRMKRIGQNRLYGLMLGLSQSEIATREGATQGAISQSLARSGAFAIVAAQGQLEERYR
jgi:hypothetical protein